jgi:hypothetical protein
MIWVNLLLLHLAFLLVINVIDSVNDTGIETNNEYKLELNDLSEVELDNTDGEFQTSAFWIPALGVFVGLSTLEMLAISVGGFNLNILISF